METGHCWIKSQTFGEGTCGPHSTKYKDACGIKG